MTKPSPLGRLVALNVALTTPPRPKPALINWPLALVPTFALLLLIALGVL